MDEKPIAWMRKWAFDGEDPHKEKRENGRLAWRAKYKLLPVTQNKCLDDDVPLVALKAANAEVSGPEAALSPEGRARLPGCAPAHNGE